MFTTLIAFVVGGTTALVLLSMLCVGKQSDNRSFQIQAEDYLAKLAISCPHCAAHQADMRGVLTPVQEALKVG